MIQIIYQKKGLRLGQIWYLDQLEKHMPAKNMDLIFYHGIEKETILPINIKKYGIVSEFHTLMTNLEKSEEEILMDISKTERYQIRKSEKDGGEVYFFEGENLLSNEKVIHGLAQMYEEMYREKGTEQNFNMVQFKEYLKQNGITVSCIYQEETPLVFHSYVMDEKQARLLHSVSEFRNPAVEANVIGRANKRLHYEDMCYFKKKGLKDYDWGGISSFDNPNGIDIFKMKFGGEKLTYNNIIYGNTILGKLGIMVMRFFKK